MMAMMMTMMRRPDSFLEGDTVNTDIETDDGDYRETIPTMAFRRVEYVPPRRHKRRFRKMSSEDTNASHHVPPPKNRNPSARFNRAAGTISNLATFAGPGGHEQFVDLLRLMSFAEFDGNVMWLLKRLKRRFKKHTPKKTRRLVLMFRREDRVDWEQITEQDEKRRNYKANLRQLKGDLKDLTPQELRCLYAKVLEVLSKRIVPTVNIPETNENHLMSDLEGETVEANVREMDVNGRTSDLEDEATDANVHEMDENDRASDHDELSDSMIASVE